MRYGLATLPLRCGLMGILVVFFGMSLPVAPAIAQAAKAECTVLTCAKCSSVCKASCEADLKSCEAAKSRSCPRLYRSCLKGCTSQLCAQCLPVQYGADNTKFLPGRTQLCRTPGRLVTKTS